MNFTYKSIGHFGPFWENDLTHTPQHFGPFWENDFNYNPQHFRILIFFIVALQSGNRDNCGVSNHQL